MPRCAVPAKLPASWFGPSRGTKERRWPVTSRSQSTPACRSTSAIPTALGSAALTRHQWALAPVHAKGHRPPAARRAGSRQLREESQQSTAQDVRIHETIRAAVRASCAHRLNPPIYSGEEPRGTGATAVSSWLLARTRRCGHTGRRTGRSAQPGVKRCAYVRS